MESLKKMMEGKSLEEFFHAMAERNRLQILAALAEDFKEGMTYTELRKKTGLHWNTLSYNLGVLFDAKLIEERGGEKGGEASYRITELGRSYLREASSY